MAKMNARMMRTKMALEVAANYTPNACLRWATWQRFPYNRVRGKSSFPEY